MFIRFAGSLEPERHTVGFQANEAERRASIQLAEVAGKADAEWRDLLFVHRDSSRSQPARPKGPGFSPVA